MATVTAACDAGDRREQRTVGPLITVLDINVGPQKSIPADGVIQIAFDRYLLAEPTTILRQSYVIVDNQNKPIPTDALQTVYDPVARTITIRGAQGPGRPFLQPGQAYKLVLGIPAEGSNVGGFRAIDGATLNPSQPLEFAFTTGPETKVTDIEPTVSFCSDVFPMFVQKCGSTPSCHGTGSNAAASLVLDTSISVQKTAIKRIAQGANTGGRIEEESQGKVFGINMPLIDPGNPGNSWLLYKMELARLPKIDGGPGEPFVFVAQPDEGGILQVPGSTEDVRLCQVPRPNAVPPPATTRLYSPLVRHQPEADETERAILNDYVLGREMPYPSAQASTYIDLPATFQERELLRLWIAQGAVVSECGGCRTQVATLVPDAGPSDASGQ